MRCCDDPRRERELERHVRASLGLSADQVTATMWAPPRALMTSVVPTLLRRVETNWMTAAGPRHARQTHS